MENDLQPLLEAAKDHFNKGHYKLAEPLLTQLQSEALQKPDIYYMLAAIAFDRGQLKKAIQLFKQSLEVDPEFTDSAVGLSIILNDLGRYDEARADVGESLAIFEEISYERGIAYALFTQGSIDMALSGFDSARQILERSLAILEKLHDRWWIGAARFQLAWITDREGSHESARDLLREILGEQRKLGDQRGTARCLLYLAEAQAHCGQFAEAKESVMESLEIVDRLCDKWWLAVCLLVLALCEYSLGDGEKSARLLGHAESLHETMKAPAMPVYKTELESLGQKLESALGQAVFESQKASGRAYCLEDLVAG